jgi:hypothetical protein
MAGCEHTSTKWKDSNGCHHRSRSSAIIQVHEYFLGGMTFSWLTFSGFYFVARRPLHSQPWLSSTSAVLHVSSAFAAHHSVADTWT